MKKIKIFFGIFLFCFFYLGCDGDMAYATEKKSVEIEKVEVVVYSAPKSGFDGTETPILGCGSSLTLRARVTLSDGTIAKNGDAKVIWNVKRKDGTGSVGKAYEYTITDDMDFFTDGKYNQFDLFKIYAPYCAEEDLIVTATSVLDDSKTGDYELSTRYEDENSRTFFGFQEEVPKGATITGAAIVVSESAVLGNCVTGTAMTVTGSSVTGSSVIVNEVWNKDDKSYSIILPENPYYVEGYEFVGWSVEGGKDKKIYQPGENVIYCVKGEVFCIIIPEFKSLKSPIVTPEVKVGDKKVYAKNTYKVTSVKNGKIKVALVKGNKTVKKVKIPKVIKIKGKSAQVTSIAAKAFQNCKKLTYVSIGDNVTCIGKQAFQDCKKLKTIVIKTKKLKIVGKNAIRGINKKAVLKAPKNKMKSYKKCFVEKTGYKNTMKWKKQK